jgi:hypothetical protein
MRGCNEALAVAEDSIRFGCVNIWRLPLYRIGRFAGEDQGAALA